MTCVRFLRHAPPYMPGDTLLYEDALARDLAAKGLVEIIPDEAPKKDPPPKPAKT
ncbi:MAG: hypothetical protein M0006_01290 [Magnetospirillum sp.]|nr:hypothetical protein [Magnetospirillum sp.]